MNHLLKKMGHPTVLDIEIMVHYSLNWVLHDESIDGERKKFDPSSQL